MELGTWMAINSRDRRASCLGKGIDALCVRPNPDGGLNAGDRAQTAAIYRGLTMGAIVSVRRRLLLLKVG
jgi:hypothetical protein